MKQHTKEIDLSSDVKWQTKVKRAMIMANSSGEDGESLSGGVPHSFPGREYTENMAYRPNFHLLTLRRS